MSFSPSYKKRKVAGDGSEPDASKYAVQILDGFTVHKNKTEFLTAAKGQPGILAQLLASNITVDVSSAGIVLMPVCKSLDIKRNNKSMVIQKLKFGDKSKLQGSALSRLGGAWKQFRSGYSSLIWANEEPDCLEALLLPDCDVVLSERTNPSNEEVTVKQRTLFCVGSVKNFYLCPEDAIKVLGADGICVPHMRRILDAMNAIARVDYDYEFKEPTLDYALTLANNAQSGKLTRAYATTLIGAFMQSSTWDERLVQFLKDPTLLMATVLKIPKPLTKSLVDADHKPIKRKVLSELKDDDQILMSDLSVTSQFYSNVKATKLQVYVYEENRKCGTKMGNRFQELANPIWKPAQDYVAIVDAITNKRAKEVKLAEPTADGVDSDSDGEGAAFVF